MQLFIGDIVMGKITKNLPDSHSYLVWITGTQLFGTLPKTDALKQYRVGETILGAVKDIKGARITLSQRIPQFTKKIMELELRDTIIRLGWEIKRAVVRPPVGKVLIKSQNGDNFFKMNEIFLKEKKQRKLLESYYGGIRVYLIPKVEDFIEQVLEALRPAPVDKIISVQKFGSEVVVQVPQELAGMFIGKDGSNLITASKLLGVEIKISGN